jgi:dihydrofolate synthase/folylpolyglutamate synthase
MELLTLTGASTAVPADRAAATAGSPDLLLDGAHNVAGLTALVAALDELKPQLSGGRPTLLIGMMRDKEVAPILERLRTSVTLQNATVVATQVDAPRRLGARELADAWRHGASEAHSEEPQEVVAIPDTEEAREHSIARSRAEDGLLLVCGSLYLVGAVRGALVDDPELRDPPRLTTARDAPGA